VAFNAYVLGLEHHKLAEFVALNTGIAIATVFRFWSYRRFVWAAPAAGARTGTAAPLDAEHLGQAVSGVPLVEESQKGHVLNPSGNGQAPDGRGAHKDSFSRS
jgi:hypothetical protein